MFSYTFFVFIFVKRFMPSERSCACVALLRVTLASSCSAFEPQRCASQAMCSSTTTDTLQFSFTSPYHSREVRSQEAKDAVSHRGWQRHTHKWYVQHAPKGTSNFARPELQQSCYRLSELRSQKYLLQNWGQISRGTT